MAEGVATSQRRYYISSLSADAKALLRRMAMNLLKRDKSVKVGIEAKRKRAGWDEKYLLKVLAQ